MDNEEQEKIRGNGFSVTSVCLGIASMIFWEFSIIPISAILAGILGAIYDRKKWLAGIGIILGIVFLIVRISHGNVDMGFSNIIQKNGQNNVVDTVVDASIYKKPPYITNPAYLQNPNSFLVDSDGTVRGDGAIRNLINITKRGQEVWVERFLRMVTGQGPLFLVSYTYQSAGRNIISFDGVILGSFGDYLNPINNTSCSKNIFQNALEDVIIGKYVVVTLDDFMLKEQDMSPVLLDGVNIQTYCTDKQLLIPWNNCFTDKSNEVSARELLAANGYSYDTDFNPLVSNSMKVAKLAKKGAWGQCVQ